MNISRSLRICFLLLFLLHSGPVGALAPEETGFKTKTSKFSAFQETTSTASSTILEKTFTVYMGESLPLIKSAFIEIKGLSDTAASQSIDLQIKQQGDAGYSNLQTLTFASPNRSTHFKLRYNVTSFMASRITASGPYTFVLYLKNNGPAALYALHGRAILTYQFTPPSSGGYRASGYVISSTLDTTNTKGAAPNTIMWQGILPATSHVKFQFASSNCPSGHTDPPTCTTGTWSFIGPDGTASTFYEPSGPDVALSFDASHHNNKRYFKYKVTLNPTSDLQQTPTVNDIILNWSP